VFEQEQEEIMERPKCVYFNSDVCLNLKAVPLTAQCHLCHNRIENLKDFIIQNRFTDEKYKINQIHFPLKERDYVAEDDMFQNPIFNCLKKARFLDPEKKDMIMFNVFNINLNEYYFEIFELPLSDLSNFIWHLEEFGYSEQLLSQFKENIIELELKNEVNK